jgi:hypothetical protein
MYMTNDPQRPKRSLEDHFIGPSRNAVQRQALASESVEVLNDWN